jgi:hypothetical protein
MSGLVDIDYFFFAGEKSVPIEDQVQNDLMVGLLESKGRLFYSRYYGADITKFENHPVASFSDVMMKYSAQEFIASRNQEVSDGRNDTLDLRVASSQERMEIRRDANGNRDLNIYYILFATAEEEKLVYSDGEVADVK